MLPYDATEKSSIGHFRNINYGAFLHETITSSEFLQISTKIAHMSQLSATKNIVSFSWDVTKHGKSANLIKIERI